MNISAIEQRHLRKDLPDIRPGDTIRVSQRLKEDDKSRTARFEGTVIARKHGAGINATITVRKVIQEIGVERVFPLHSPVIERIEIVRRPTRIRRAKLYFIRRKAARVIRKKMKQMRRMDIVPVVEDAAQSPIPQSDSVSIIEGSSNE